KIEAGRLTLDANSFDLYHLLDGLDDTLRLKAESKRLQLSFERPLDLPQYVQTDEKKLRQVLINLLGNAIKFTQRGGVVLRVKAESPQTSNSSPHTLYFEVEDTGPGIAASELDTLFDPFVQVKTMPTSQEGTGLGLPISRQFVQLMGGDITVRSTPGQGTIFSFNIQAQPATTTDLQTQQRLPQVIGLASGQPTYRILVADDRPDNRQLLLKLLVPIGFEVHVAENGQAAIDVWQSWHPQLIWMDMRMPIMDGYEATRQIRAIETSPAMSLSPAISALHARTIIIALTASAFEEERAIVLSAGCDDFVRKPFREEVIFEKIAEHLGVQYVYQEQTEDKGPEEEILSAASSGLFNSSTLKIMPAEWINQLHQAASKGSDQEILRLVERIPASCVSLATVLTGLANNFQFGKIIEITQQFEA
ncbi:MAG: response regulator, partial [Cyanothece sp. SIO1E1]|nr:response regulator [Cyanothece sp. SIO1E1]